MVRIPSNLQVASQAASNRLLEKQWRARVWMRANPFAYAMNMKLKSFYKHSAKSKAMT